MTGLVRKATLLSACGLLVAGAAMAAVPFPGNSTIPADILVVAGNSGGTFDPDGQFTVVVRDVANNVIANSSVVIDFSGCSDGRICQATSMALGQLVDCVTNTVRNITDVTGTASFNILGSVTTRTLGDPNPTGPGQFCASVLADGVNLGQVSVIYFDQDANISTGVNVVDQSLVFGDVFSPHGFLSRANISTLLGDPSPVLNVIDVSALAGKVFQAGGPSGVGCQQAPYSSSYCP